LDELKAASRRFRWWALAVALSIALFVSWVVLEIGGPRVTQNFDDLVQVAAAAFGTFGCVVAARGAVGRGRGAWLLLGAATASWGIGEAIWSWYEIVLNRDVPFPSLADVGFLGLVPLAIAGMLAFPSSAARLGSRIRSLTDALVICGSLLFVSWATVLGPLYRANSGSILEQTIGLAYPASDVIIIALVASLVARSRSSGRYPLALLGTGLIAIAVADSGFAYLTTVGSYASGNLIDSGWFAGFMLIGLAGLRPDRPEAAARKHESKIRMLVPYMAGGIAIVIAGWIQGAHGILEPFLFWDMLGLVGLVMVRQMLTLRDRLSLEQELTRQAFSDSLTGLANRALFRDRVALALARMKRSGEPFAVAFLDLDDFKTTNDGMGHEAGDLLLVSVAERLRYCVRPMDTVARLGGDEFAILIERLDDIVGATRIADRAINSFHSPFDLKGKEVIVSSSIGIALCTDPNESVDDLLAHADLAMYMAKAAGKGRIEVFQPSMASTIRERAELQSDLRRAVEHGEFDLHYQPVVSVFDGSIAGIEALVRWQHPTRGSIQPGEFIGLAEDTGVIIPIGKFVIEHAMEDYAALRRTLGAAAAPWLSINLSGHQLRQTDLRDEVAQVLSRTGVAAGDVVFEITETTLLRDRDKTVGRLQELVSLGVRVAIDDFGTGYSSLSYLQFLPADFLKIDRSFVVALDGGVEDAALAHAIVRMADALGLRAVAEGVESEGQLARLRSMGCGFAQGHLFCEPRPIDEIAALITSARTAASG
jgi:diguanylate cyclase (GGDEF)-like protein